MNQQFDGNNLTSRNFYNLMKIKGIFWGLSFCLNYGIME
jgi:hypothetical protein